MAGHHVRRVCAAAAAQLWVRRTRAWPKARLRLGSVGMVLCADRAAGAEGRLRLLVQWPAAVHPQHVNNMK